MATLESDDRNIVEADAVNWRLIVYPILAVAVILLGGFGYYYYQLNEREQEETDARAQLVLAKTPADMVKVADQFPQTTQAALALIDAADASYAGKDYDGALKDYQRVIASEQAPVELRDSAQVGIGSTQEASGKPEDAIRSYLAVAQKGSHSPFAPFAYHAVAQIYEARKDKDDELRILQQTLQLGGDSPFVKEAEARLKELTSAPGSGGLPETISNGASPASSTTPAP
jgi:predicted negative regulator of RcsB-dependent stress response